MTNAAKLREALRKEFRSPSYNYLDEAEPHVDRLLDAYAAAVRDEAIEEAAIEADGLVYGEVIAKNIRALKGAKR